MVNLYRVRFTKYIIFRNIYHNVLKSTSFVTLRGFSTIFSHQWHYFWINPHIQTMNTYFMNIWTSFFNAPLLLSCPFQNFSIFQFSVLLLNFWFFLLLLVIALRKNVLSNLRKQFILLILKNKVNYLTI